MKYTLVAVCVDDTSAKQISRDWKSPFEFIFNESSRDGVFV